MNSTNLCKSTNRAIAAFEGQNRKVHNFYPVVKPQCGKQGKKQKPKQKPTPTPQPSSPYRLAP